MSVELVEWCKESQDRQDRIHNQISGMSPESQRKGKEAKSKEK